MDNAMLNASRRQSDSNNDAHEKSRIEPPVCFKRCNYHEFVAGLHEGITRARSIETGAMF